MKYNFADCILDEARLTLTRDGLPISVEPRVLDLIRVLVRSGGDLVTRDRLVEEVWQGRIVSESAISACIAAARKAVGDDGKRQAIIRTHHRRGLELIAPVVSDTVADPEANEASQAPKVRYTLSKRGHSLAYLVSGAGPPLFQVDGPPLSKEGAWHIPVLRDAYAAYRKGRTFVQMDWSGTGLSEALDTALSVEEHAEDMISVADAIGPEQFALMSESGACLEAVTVAATYPERVSRLVIVGGYTEGRALRDERGRPELLKTMMEAGWDHHEGGIATAFMIA